MGHQHEACTMLTVCYFLHSTVSVTYCPGQVGIMELTCMLTLQEEPEIDIKGSETYTLVMVST